LATRWLWTLGAVTIAVVVGVSLGEHPSPALHGGGLVTAAALLLLIASAGALLRRATADAAKAPALVVMIAASTALVWEQPDGPGMAGIFLAASYAAMRLTPRRSLGVLALALGAFVAIAAHTHRSLGLIVASELGIVAFYVIVAFARRVQSDHEQTRELLAELEATRHSHEEAAALRERSRIAREMHDVLAHSLSGLMLQLEGARMLAARANSNGQLPTALDRAHHLAHVGLEEARRAIAALRDERLPGPDLLDQLAADFKLDSRISASVEINGEPRRLDSETSLTLYRVAQEALTNSLKHSQPERVELHLDYQRNGVRLIVEDHAEPSTRPEGDTTHGERPGPGNDDGYGLTGMRERAELLGGRLDAGSTDDGFRVELWVPHEQ
jgi:signal transduction histidine kinase